MPDLMNLTYTPLERNDGTVPCIEISGQVATSDAANTILTDFSGTNALVFPSVVATLSAEDQLELLHMITPWLLQKKGLL